MRVNPDELSLNDKVVFINRVAKVEKGGKRFNFCALVVVGDGHGWVGIGKGKAAEVPVAISKVVEQAKKHLVHVPHYIKAKSHTTRVTKTAISKAT